MVRQYLLLLALMLFFQATARAQTITEPRNSPTPDITTERRSNVPFLGSPEEELRHRAAIKHEEAAHKENLERAKESAQLGAELRAEFERNKSLGRDDVKKLERMNKLARKIRGHVGGSDGDDDALESPPQELGTALSQLAELSEELRESVEKTSRLVVSAAVIERSNKMIELIRHVRTFVQ